ncbi:MAG TPA: hypothetical protein VGB85_03075, partial [Nannocystis sp.]
MPIACTASLGGWTPLPPDFDLDLERALAARKNTQERQVFLAGFAVQDALWSQPAGQMYAALKATTGEAVHLFVLTRRLNGPNGEWVGHALARLRAADPPPVPGVVSALHVAIVGGQLCLTYRPFGTRTLSAACAAGSPRDILASFIATGEVLAAAHAAGLVHGDFSPDYVMLEADGAPRVFGFGLAEALGLHNWGAPAKLLCNEYAAPESQIGPSKASTDQKTAADQYNFAASLKASLLARAALPPELARMLTRAMHPAPGLRYPQLAELVRDLRTVRLPGERKGLLARFATRVPHGSSNMRRAAAGLAAGVVAAGLGSGGLQYYRIQVARTILCNEPAMAARERLASALSEAIPRPTWEAQWRRIPAVLDGWDRFWLCEPRTTLTAEEQPVQACRAIQDRRMAHIAELVEERKDQSEDNVLLATYRAGISTYMVGDPETCSDVVHEPTEGVDDEVLLDAYAKIEN